MSIEVDLHTRRVRIDVAGSFNADELLDLLKSLAAARAQVANDPARPGDVWVAPKAAVHTQLMGTDGPESLLALQFPGIGWIGATLSPAVRAQLIGLLANQQATVAMVPAAPVQLPVVPAVPEATTSPVVDLAPDQNGKRTLH